MNDKLLNEKAAIPPLIDLPVYRDTYCDQKMTDDLLRHLWETRADLISEAAILEVKPDAYRIHADYQYKDVLDKVITYLRKALPEELKAPPSRLGMLDLLYEFSRRLRGSTGQEQLILLGQPLAPSPEGPYPALPNTPVWPGRRFTQETADAVLQEAYRLNPAAFYECAEQMRRSIRSYEIDDEIEALITKTVNILGLENNIVNQIYGEALHRLFEICEMKIKTK